MCVLSAPKTFESICRRKRRVTQTDPIPASEPAQHPTRKWIIRLIKFLLTLLVVYFAGREIAGNWQEVVNYQWQINWWLILLSVALHLFAFAFFSQDWCWLMRGFGHTVPLRHGFKIAYIANLGRYIPGRIWPIFGMVYVAKQMKISDSVAVASWGLALLFGMPPSFVAVFLATSIYPEMLSPDLRQYLGAALYLGMAVTFAVSLMLLIMPNRSLALANFFLRMIKREAIHFHLTVSQAALVYFGYFFGWLSYGLAFFVFVHAVTLDPNLPVMVAIGAFILSYQIGYLAIFTPGGLGARELVMIAVLTPYLGPAGAGIAIAARLWNTFCDIVASALALRIKI